MNWRIIRAVVKKDMLDAVKNRWLLFGLLLPIFMALLFRLVFPNSDQPTSIKIALYDPGSSAMEAALRANPQVDLLVEDSTEAVKGAVQKDAVGGIALPTDFDALLQSGDQPSITVYADSRQMGWERLAFQRVLENQVWAEAGYHFPAKVNQVDVSQTGAAAGVQNLNLTQYLLVLFLIMSLSMTGVFLVPLLVVEEKEKHTMQVLLLSPASEADIIFGKALTGLIYSLLLCAILLLLNPGQVGNWPLIGLVLFFGSLFVVLVGLLMGSAMRTIMNVNAWSSVVMLILMIPSWIAIIRMNPTLEWVLKLVPTYYLVNAIELALNNTRQMGPLGLNLLVLLACTMVVFALGVGFLRRETRR